MLCEHPGRDQGLMVLKSELPADLSPAIRLREYLALVKELSLQRDPHGLLQSYGTRSRFVVPADHLISLSRSGLSGCQVRITRTTRWKEPIDPWREPHRLPVIESGLLCELMRAGKPVKIDQIEVSPRDPVAPYLEGMNSLIACPVFDEGEPRYMVILLRAEPAAFTLDELATALLTSNLIGRATSHLVLAEELRSAYAALDREFRLVGELQRGLLPQQLPKIPGVRLATYYQTSTRAGGDYYDCFQTGSGEWCFLIADVSGHGAAAAVVVAMMHTLMKSPLAAGLDRQGSPAALLRHLNAELLRLIPDGQFVTAFIGMYHPVRHTFRYASAGHNPPRWLRRGTPTVIPLLAEEGLPLAVTPAYSCTDHVIEVQPGDRILLYTDGVTETFNAQRDMFGIEGVDAALRRCSRSPESMVSCVLSDLTAFAPNPRIEDDRTLLAIAFDDAHLSAGPDSCCPPT